MAEAPSGLASLLYRLLCHHVRGTRSAERNISWTVLALFFTSYPPLPLVSCDVQDLKEDPIEELKKLLIHLEVEIDQGRLDCIDKHSEGSFHRINKNNTEDPFTQELHQLLDTNILTADSLLKNITGRGLPLTKYKNYN